MVEQSELAEGATAGEVAAQVEGLLGALPYYAAAAQEVVLATERGHRARTAGETEWPRIVLVLTAPAPDDDWAATPVQSVRYFAASGFAAGRRVDGFAASLRAFRRRLEEDAARQLRYWRAATLERANRMADNVVAKALAGLACAQLAEPVEHAMELGEVVHRAVVERVEKLAATWTLAEIVSAEYADVAWGGEESPEAPAVPWLTGDTWWSYVQAPVPSASLASLAAMVDQFGVAVRALK